MKLPRKTRLSLLFAGIATTVFLLAPLVGKVVMLFTPSGAGDWGNELLAILACAVVVVVLMLIAMGYAAFSWEEEGRPGTLAFFAEVVWSIALVAGAVPYLTLWGG